jgi:hypothetical protein
VFGRVLEKFLLETRTREGEIAKLFLGVIKKV